MKVLNYLFAGLFLSAGIAASAQAEPQLLDRVVAIVDQGVVLESEVTQMVAEIRRSAKEAGQELPSDEALKTQILERLINNSLQLQLAEKMGLQVTDAQVDQTITNLAQDKGKTVDQFRLNLESDGESFNAFREQVRDELTMGDVRRAAVQRRITISPQEIDAVLKQMSEQQMANQDFHMGHILIETTSTDAEAIEQAKKRAEEVMALLEKGSDFKKMALAASSGPKALEGGDWGWMNINEMPSLLSNVASTAKVDELNGPLRTNRGFHIIKVFDIRGAQKVEVKEVNARHILLSPSIILTEQKAQQMLEEFLIEIKANPDRFAEIAKEYSDDPGSGANGGELGWADPQIFVPAFRRTLANLDPGEISAPFRSQFGWHIIQLHEERTQDVTKDRMRSRAQQLIFNRKFTEQQGIWLQELRSQAFIDIIEPSNNES